MIERMQRLINRINENLARKSQVQLAAIFGVGFGLLLCVVVALVILLILFIASLR